MQSASRVTILLLPESSIMTFASTLDPLRAANRLSAEPAFEWRIVSPSGDPVRLTCGIDIDVDGPLTGRENGDLLVVVAAFHSEQHADRGVIRKLGNAATGFATVCGVEAGSWLLARAKIVRNHAVTTHWEDSEALQHAFPALDVRKDRYVIDHNVWTTGGASPTLDMLLHYIRTHKRPSLAIDVASVFIYDQAHAATDAQPTVSMGRLELVEPRIAAAVRLMEKNLEDTLPITGICAQVGLSAKMLELLCKRHLGETPGSYYRRLRLQTARKLVIDSHLSMHDIGIRCGFNSQSNFSRSFQKFYGYPPQTLRRQLL
jgi:transcriptional regulator GlxA family with amidase domain